MNLSHAEVQPHDTLPVSRARGNDARGFGLGSLWLGGHYKRQ